jgi:hypothetical protein
LERLFDDRAARLPVPSEQGLEVAGEDIFLNHGFSFIYLTQVRWLSGMCGSVTWHSMLSWINISIVVVSEVSAKNPELKWARLAVREDLCRQPLSALWRARIGADFGAMCWTRAGMVRERVAG